MPKFIKTRAIKKIKEGHKNDENELKLVLGTIQTSKQLETSTCYRILASDVIQLVNQ